MQWELPVLLLVLFPIPEHVERNEFQIQAVLALPQPRFRELGRKSGFIRNKSLFFSSSDLLGNAPGLNVGLVLLDVGNSGQKFSSQVGNEGWGSFGFRTTPKMIQDWAGLGKRPVQDMSWTGQTGGVWCGHGAFVNPREFKSH